MTTTKPDSHTLRCRTGRTLACAAVLSAGALGFVAAAQAEPTGHAAPPTPGAEPAALPAPPTLEWAFAELANTLPRREPRRDDPGCPVADR